MKNSNRDIMDMIGETAAPARLRCMIIDDEELALRSLMRLAARRPELEVMARADSPAMALQMIEKGTAPDLLFPDIDMNGQNGLTLARELEGRFMIIFTTAYSQYALESYEVEAVDYLLKPISASRFDQAVDKALSRYSRNVSEADAPIVVKAEGRFIRIEPSSILFVEGLGDYLVIHLPDRRITTRMTFKTLSEKLPEREFLRTGKSYMVNVRHIESFDQTSVTIENKKIPIGAAYREGVMAVLLGK